MSGASFVRRHPWSWISWLVLALALAVFLWQLPHFRAGNSTIWPQYATAFSDMLFYTLWGGAVLVGLTAFTRTVPLRQLLACWFLGVFAVHGLVVAAERPFLAGMGVVEMSIWVAPVIETLFLLVVVVGFYAVSTVRRGTHPTVSDGLLVGFATGAGLAFHEDMTYGRVMAIGPGAEYHTVGRMGQEIWWSYLVPLVGWQGLFNVRQFGNGLLGNFALYHAGWATLVGVGVGLVFVHRESALAWLAGALAVAVTYFDHMSGNVGVWRPLESAPVVGDLFQAGDATGVSELSVYVLLVAIAGTVVADLVVLRRSARNLDGFPAVWSLLRDGGGDQGEDDGPDGARGGIGRRLLALATYARFRRSFAVGLHRVEASGDRPEVLGSALAVLYEKARSARVFAVAILASVSGLVLFTLAGPGWVPLGTTAPSLVNSYCAGCVSAARLLDTTPAVLGAVFAVLSVVAGARAPVTRSLRSAGTASDDTAQAVDVAGGSQGTSPPGPPLPETGTQGPPPPPDSGWSRPRGFHLDAPPSSPGGPAQMGAYYDPETGRIVLKGVEKESGTPNQTGWYG